jgi:uncharacterized protein (DUF58 family)
VKIFTNYSSNKRLKLGRRHNESHQTLFEKEGEEEGGLREYNRRSEVCQSTL